MKVYLAGSINGCTDAEAKDWRAVARTMFEAEGFDVLDPMVRDYRGRELEEGIAQRIVEQDKNDIDSVNVVVVYYEKPSVGTAMEVLYAWQKDKVVVVIDRSGRPLSPWLVYHSTSIVTSLQESLIVALRWK